MLTTDSQGSLQEIEEVAMCFKAVYVVSYGRFYLWSNGRHRVNMSIKRKVE